MTLPPHWPALRAAAERRAGGQCQCRGRCGRNHRGRCPRGSTHHDAHVQAKPEPVRATWVDEAALVLCAYCRRRVKR